LVVGAQKASSAFACSRRPASCVHQGLAALPQRLVHVHAGSVLLEDRLGHERRRLPGLLGRVLDHVLVQLEGVGHLQQRQEAQVDLTLAGAADLVVVALGSDPERLQHQDHGGAEIAQRVVRRRREVALLRAVLVAQRSESLAAALEALARGPVTLLGLDLVEGRVRLLVEGDVVEHVELGLRTEVARVRHPARDQVLLSLDRDVARVPRVGLAGDRVQDRADDRDRRRLVERVEDRRRGIGHEQHVRLVDLLEAPDRGPVEADALGEGVGVEALERHAHVLPRSGQVGELEVDHPRSVPLGEREHVARRRAAVAHERAHVERVGRLRVHEVRDRHDVSSGRRAAALSRSRPDGESPAENLRHRDKEASPSSAHHSG
jgi:hypothetical protein